MSPRLNSSIRGNAHLGSGGLPGVQDLPAHPRPLDGDLTTDAVPVVGSAEVVFQLFVDRQCLAGTVRATPKPSLITGGLGPQVVIGGLSAHMDHGVDRRGAADHAAPRVVNAAAGQTWVSLGREAPVGAGVGNCVQVAHRHLDPEPVVFAAGLNQEHTVIRVGAEPVGEQAARTACSHDDEVEFGDGAHFRHRSSLASDACPSVRCPPGTWTFPCVLWQSTVSSSSGETKTSWPVVGAKLDARASRLGRASEMAFLGLARVRS